MEFTYNVVCDFLFEVLKGVRNSLCIQWPIIRIEIQAQKIKANDWFLLHTCLLLCYVIVNTLPGNLILWVIHYVININQQQRNSAPWKHIHTWSNYSGKSEFLLSGKPLKTIARIQQQLIEQAQNRGCDRSSACPKTSVGRGATPTARIWHYWFVQPPWLATIASALYHLPGFVWSLNRFSTSLFRLLATLSLLWWWFKVIQTVDDLSSMSETWSDLRLRSALFVISDVCIIFDCEMFYFSKQIMSVYLYTTVERINKVRNH